MNNKLLPGESLTTTTDGNIVLTMRNGMTQEFTPDDWDEYNSEYMESISTVERIDIALDVIKGRQIVETSEMVDVLLDLRKQAALEGERLQEAIKAWMKLAGVK